jgi:hypothetical protein
MNQEKEVDKKAKLLRHIFKAKYVLNKLKYNACVRRNKRYSKVLAGEFKKNTLMKKIFRLFYNNYSEVVNKRNKKFE